MKFISKGFSTLILILCLCFVANAQADWTGEYFFGEDGGETAGGSKIYIAHNLKITQEGENLKAHIYSQGFQTSIDLFADAKAEGNKLLLYFREKGKDHFLGEYEKGDLLLTLEKKEFDGRSEILTYWEEFKPSLEANGQTGKVYFAIVSEKKDSETGTEWTRIEFEETELSVVFPPGFIVDAEKNGKSKQILKIFGFQKDFEAILSVYKDGDSFERLNRFIRKDDRKYESFEIGDFKGLRSYLINSSSKLNESLNLATKKYFYHLSIDTTPDKKEEVAKFLLSMQINGKPVFSSNENKKTYSEKSVLASELQTSPEITETRKRKSKKSKEKVSYILVTEKDIERTETKGLTRPVIIVERPFPNLNFGPLLNIRPQSPNETVRLITFKVQFLANGQIGKITAFSPEEDPFTQACLKSVQKIRFIPAQKDGKNVDAEKIVEYLMSFFVTPA